MALNSLKIATGGYLKRTTKAVLIIAVAGYLNFQDVPTPPPSGGEHKFYGNNRRKIIAEKKETEIDKVAISNFIVLETIQSFLLNKRNY